MQTGSKLCTSDSVSKTEYVVHFHEMITDKQIIVNKHEPKSTS